MRKTAIVLIIVLAIVSPEAIAQVPQEQNVIVTTGMAELRLAPDRAVLVLGIEAQRSTASEVMGSVSHTVRLVLGALRKVGLPQENLQTSGISLVPVYAKVSGVETIVGYRALYTITATVDDLDLVGKSLDSAITAGANRIHGISWTLRNPEEARRKVLAAAMRDARMRAEAIAEAAGLQIKRIVRILEGGAEVIPVRFTPTTIMRVQSAPEVPVEPGQVVVTGRVTVVFGY